VILPKFDHPFCEDENSFYDLSKFVANENVQENTNEDLQVENPFVA